MSLHFVLTFSLHSYKKGKKYSFSPTHSLKVQAVLSEFIQTPSSVRMLAVNSNWGEVVTLITVHCRSPNMNINGLSNIE